MIGVQLLGLVVSFTQAFHEIGSDQIWSDGAPMIVDTITEATTHFSSKIDRVQHGEEIVIKKAGIPVTVIRPYAAQTSERLPCALAGKIRIAPDFDDLPTELAKAFGMEA